MSGHLSAEGKILNSYIQEQPPGIFLAYNRVEADTGVRMDIRGRDALRRALDRAGIEYLCEVDVGITLMCPNNSGYIIADKMTRIRSSAKRVETAATNILNRHGSELALPDRDMLMYALGASAAMNAYQQMGVKFFPAKKPKLLGTPEKIN